MDATFLFGGLVRLQVLHHAAREPIYGLAVIQQLERLGYRLSPGTLYPVLHDLERRGLLVSEQMRSGRARRRVYRATQAGLHALTIETQRLRTVLAELSDAKPAPAAPARPRSRN
jgi:DNA-binding PadR family transcriptional regulator